VKVFVHVTASAIDKIQNEIFSGEKNYHEMLYALLSWGSASLMGVEKEKLGHEYFVSISNSKYLQSKWAEEQSIELKQNTNWQIDILKKQIEFFDPDILYTVNPSWISKNIDKLPDVKLLAAWRAAPIGSREDYSCFDVGLSYAPVYIELMKKHGIPKVEHMDFSFDPEVKKRLDQMNLEKQNDICFVGRYGKMFKKRNKLLYDVYCKFKDSNKIAYHLLTEKRFCGLIPQLPWRMLNAVNGPVFLNELLEVFARSKIIINAHSDIAGQYKGNMRVFEALGTGAFMLSDKGIYPEFLKDGEDFVSYENTNDLLDKIEYYLKNEDEREEIAKNGYETICKHYSTETGNKKLKSIFEEYL
jgi:glycosyltransferase involved in cell wall biosynthesis